jgi:hypothetical protein
MNVAIALVLGFALALSIAAYLLFGRLDSISGFEVESAKKSPDLTTDKAFAEHMIANSVYSRIYDAYAAVFNSKPSLDAVEYVSKAYRAGRAKMDELAEFVKSNKREIENASVAKKDDGDSESDDEEEEEEEDDGKDRTPTASPGADGSDRSGANRSDGGSDRSGATRNDGGSDRSGATRSGGGIDRSGEKGDEEEDEDDESDEDKDDEDEGDEDKDDEDKDDEDNGEVDAIFVNIRRALRLAGVAITEDNMQTSIDRVRKGLSSLQSVAKDIMQKI